MVDRDHWYPMLLEVQRGWRVAQARKDPGVMETAMCHVVLLDAIVGSGLLDRLNHTQRGKCMMVSGGEEERRRGREMLNSFEGEYFPFLQLTNFVVKTFVINKTS